MILPSASTPMEDQVAEMLVLVEQDKLMSIQRQFINSM
jgi:hypothetical protein